MAKAVSDRLARVLRVTEVFKSIQGESTWAGRPCTFIRLTGCPLRCRWCDTEYAFEGGVETTVGELIAQCDDLGGRLVEITGGEPLAQQACPELAAELLEQGYTVLVETSGALPIDRLPAAAIKIMDLKCPDSGVSDRNHWPNLALLSARDEVKFVLASREDYEWARGVVQERDLKARCNAVLFSPVLGAVEAVALAQWILEDGLDVRMQLQLHKLIWPPETRGV